MPSSKPDHLEFYKEVYYKELERRNSLNTEIALNGTILVAVISGIFFLLTNLKSERVWLHHIFSWLVVIETLIGLVTTFYLLRSYYDFTGNGRKYSYLPTMKLVDEYYQQVDKKAFDNFLKGSFIEACDSHIDNNDHKSILLTKSASCMTCLMIGGAILTLIFLCDYLFDNPNLKTTKSHAIQNRKPSATAPISASTAATRAAARTDSAATQKPRNTRTRGQHAVHHKAVK